MATKLETAANIAILGTCALICVVLVRSVTNTRGPSRAPGYARGDSMPRLVGMDYRQSEQTLLLIIRSTCHICDESMPFYKKLSQAPLRRARRLRIVALAVDSPEDAASYIEEHALDVDKLVTAKPQQLRITGVPTLILVDKDGIVQRTWVGQLSADERSEVVRALEGGG